MNHFTRNQTKQNIIGVIVGLIVLALCAFGATRIRIADEPTEVFVRMFLYLFLMLISGMIIGSISFRKDGYKILSILVPLAILGDFIYIILDFYAMNSSPYTVDMKDAISLLKLGPGAIFAFIGCFLSIFIKYKVQRGANFSLHFIKENK